MSDGGVFVSGQLQEPMEAPAVPLALKWDAEAKAFRSLAAGVNAPVITVGSTIIGTEAPREEIICVEIENFISAPSVGPIPDVVSLSFWTDPSYWDFIGDNPYVILKGDGRPFIHKPGNEYYRTVQRVEFSTNYIGETSPIVRGGVFKDTGVSERIYPSRIVGKAIDQSFWIEHGVVIPGTNLAEIEISGSSKIPDNILLIAPSIDWGITLTINSSIRSIHLEGSTDGYPSTSIYVYKKKNEQIFWSFEALEPSEGPFGLPGPVNLLPAIGDIPIYATFKY